MGKWWLIMVNHGLIMVAKKVIFMMVITGDFYGIIYVYRKIKEMCSWLLLANMFNVGKPKPAINQP